MSGLASCSEHVRSMTREHVRARIRDRRAAHASGVSASAKCLTAAHERRLAFAIAVPIAFVPTAGSL